MSSEKAATDPRGAAPQSAQVDLLTSALEVHARVELSEQLQLVLERAVA